MAAVGKASAKRKKQNRPAGTRTKSAPAPPERQPDPESEPEPKLQAPDPAAPQVARGTLLLASWMVLAECAALAAVLAYLVYASITDSRANVKQGVLVTVYAALFVAALALIAWGLRHRKVWSRGPAVALHLLLVPLGWYMIAGGAPAPGVASILLGAGGSVLLLLPGTAAQLPSRR